MTLEAYVELQVATIQDVAEITPWLNDENGDPRPLADWWYSASSLGLGENVAHPRQPYFVWNELDDFVHQAVRETSNARTRFFSWWVYDEPGDYTRIDRCLMALRDVLKEMGEFVTPSGIICSESKWLGISRQIPNDGYGSCTKYGSVSFTVNH